jgi:hypothetical protein
MIMVRYSLLALTLAFLFLAQTLSLAGEDQGRNWKRRVSAKNLEVYSQQDAEEEIALGREIAARVLGRYPLYPDPQVQKYVNLIGQALAQNAPTPELVFHFAVIDSPARKLLIAPGAYVFISSGAIRCMRDESELAVSRTLVISSKTRLQQTQKDLNGNLNMFNPPDSGKKREYPYQFSVGAAYFPSPKLLISADLTYFTGVDYSILGMTTRKEPVLNAALGAEYYFTRNWALRGGLFSNRSNSPDVKGLPNEQTEKIDVYGVSLSLTRFIKSTSFTAGGIYSYGSGKAQITSTPGSVDAIYQSWTLFVASSYSF